MYLSTTACCLFSCLDLHTAMCCMDITPVIPFSVSLSLVRHWGPSGGINRGEGTGTSSGDGQPSTTVVTRAKYLGSSCCGIKCNMIQCVTYPATPLISKTGIFTLTRITIDLVRPVIN